MELKVELGRTGPRIQGASLYEYNRYPPLVEYSVDPKFSALLHKELATQQKNALLVRYKSEWKSDFSGQTTKELAKFMQYATSVFQKGGPNAAIVVQPSKESITLHEPNIANLFPQFSISYLPETAIMTMGTNWTLRTAADSKLVSPFYRLPAGALYVVQDRGFRLQYEGPSPQPINIVPFVENALPSIKSRMLSPAPVQHPIAVILRHIKFDSQKSA